jgi:pseudaminic acid cytidylyltransferase
MRLAVIPARGGSKRIPRKNIESFCGKPMIAWSIQAALQSRCFDEVIVSTDDREIADVARAHGAKVPFTRPSGLSDDHTGTTAVVRHAIMWFQQNDRMPSVVCCIYATAPFIQVDDLQLGLELLQNRSASFAFTVTSYPFPIQRAIRITEQGQVEMFCPENFNARSQDLEKAWHDAGQFYWGTSPAWLCEEPALSTSAIPIILPRYRVQDIDTLEDWIRAELMFRANKEIWSALEKGGSKNTS